MQRDLVGLLDFDHLMSCDFAVVLPTSHDAKDANILAALNRSRGLALVVEFCDNDTAGRITDGVDLLADLLLASVHAGDKHEHADLASMNHHRSILPALLHQGLLLQHHFDRYRHEALLFATHLPLWPGCRRSGLGCL